jgi:hypothetical protein
LKKTNESQDRTVKLKKDTLFRNLIVKMTRESDTVAPPTSSLIKKKSQNPKKTQNL